MGALVYGPCAFTVGICLAAGSRWAWLGVVPLCWFIGMLMSHLVFNRCVLNELVRRLSHFKTASKQKAFVYKRVSPRNKSVWERPSVKLGGALVEKVYDL